MKILIQSLAISLALISCDPTTRDLPAQYEGKINITAKIINPRDSIGINDTVQIFFESKDTILYNGNSVRVNYTSNDLTYTGLIFKKVDLTQAGSQGPTLGSNIYASIGSLAANKAVLTFQNNGTSVRGEYNFIPKLKGVYFIDQQLPGFLSANGGQYKLDTYWSYGNVNRNHQMLIDSAGLNSGMAGFLQSRIRSGLEVYAFKVQ